VRRVFLFSDLVGSTRLWAADPLSMQVDLAARDDLMRSVFSAHDGVVFANAGDRGPAPHREPHLDGRRRHRGSYRLRDLAGRWALFQIGPTAPDRLRTTIPAALDVELAYWDARLGGTSERGMAYPGTSDGDLEMVVVGSTTRWRARSARAIVWG
jgi:hypothetical protein